MECRVKPGNDADYSAPAGSGCAAAGGLGHRLLHLLEGAHLDLADALAGDAELGGKLLQRQRLLGKPARLEHAPLARVQALQRVVQHAAALVALLGFGKRRLLVHGVVDQPVLPLAALGIVPDRRVER